MESDVYNASEATFPVRWSPPEVLTNRQFSTKSDVWSFAITLWELFEYGTIPYPELGNADVMKYVLAGNRLSKPAICSDAMWELIMNCWATEPVDRPSTQDIYTVIAQQYKQEFFNSETGSTTSPYNRQRPTVPFAESKYIHPSIHLNQITNQKNNLSYPSNLIIN